MSFTVTPEDTNSVAPEAIVPPLSIAPAASRSVPPRSTENYVERRAARRDRLDPAAGDGPKSASVPLNETISTPPPLTSVAVAVPPARTVYVTPLVRIRPLLTMPLLTTLFVIIVT